MTKKNDTSFDVAIRNLKRPDETPVCARLMASSEPWITLGRTYENSLRMLNHPSREVSVALVNGDIVGFVVMIMRGALVGYIQTVGVAPNWRNQGIGGKLMTFAEDRIFSDSPNVFMCVSSFNDGAQRLYQRLGYEVIGELKDYVVAGHSEILLRKTIAPIVDFKKPSTADDRDEAGD